MKTSELTGAALNWAVAKALGYTASDLDLLYDIKSSDDFHPSTDWSHGGPIIEREHLTLTGCWRGGWPRTGQDAWKCTKPFVAGKLVMHFDYGPTALVAAMRCYVSSKLGNEIEIPEGLR